MTNKLLVTGASGNLGGLVLDHLLASGVAASDIIATTRDASKLADYAAKGVDVRVADFDDEAGLAEAFKGADRLALISTSELMVPGKRLTQHKAAIAAAKAAGVKHIAYTSLLNPGPESKIFFAPDHLGTEDAIKASGLTYSILRNTWYQENLLGSLPHSVETGQWFTSTANGKISLVSRADCAAALAAALASTSTASETYSVTGPDAMTFTEIAAVASDVFGKPIAVIDITDEQLAEGLKSAGLPGFVVDLVVGYEQTVRQGSFDTVSDAVETLTGKKPTGMKAFFEANKGAFGV